MYYVRRESSVLLRFGSSLGGGWSTKVLPEAMWPWALWETSSNLNVAKAGKDKQIQEHELNTFWTWIYEYLGDFSLNVVEEWQSILTKILGSYWVLRISFNWSSTWLPFQTSICILHLQFFLLWNRIFHHFVFESFWAFYGVLPVSWCSLGFWFSPLPYLSIRVHSTRPPLARGWRGVFPRLQAEKNMNETSVAWCLLSTGVFRSVSRVFCIKIMQT